MVDMSFELFQRKIEDTDLIHYATVDFINPSKITKGASVTLGGVVVLKNSAPKSCELFLDVKTEKIKVNWGIESPKMRQMYPDSINSSHSRFKVNFIWPKGVDAVALILRLPDGISIPLIELCLDKPIEIKEITIEPNNRLIFDIGAYNGNDTAYYLAKGFRVVAVEANPELAKLLEERFFTHIKANRLILINKAIHYSQTVVEFIVNPERLEWSSASGASKAKTSKSYALKIPAIKLSDLITMIGERPYYIKIDIEGGEHDALMSLREIPKDYLPNYISIELNPKLWDNIEILYELGYRRFQLVRQGKPFLPAPRWPSQEGLDFRCVFGYDMSGPFGLDLPENKWVGLADIIRQIIEAQKNMADRVSKGERPGWYDLHCSF
ncbi:FkbM family methyltransferase [Thermodesulfobacterium sp. TA1]|uniref:FkbM family methyltransferase n=1 Tax=Thermodesulfobacterium sp. TA1 TaxID=2234087 RepID=UPI001231EE49|nr:FkbM family methyltransferase [Thermodesulfobacterium sp. TA1]QER41305.1 FkbM family methyltransferase [Thermodesulfobacterium sp. TA1]